ncbi:MAG: sugar transferase, partial [Candidatus Neomarinimicrobiota bacterium]
NFTYMDPDRTQQVDAVSGSCMCLRREVMEEIGPLDETFFMFWEDTDYCYRIQKAGYRVTYHPDTKIIHYKGESVRTDPLYNLKVFHEAFIAFSRKHQGIASGALGLAFVKVLIRLRHGLAYIRSKLATFSSLFIDTAVIGAAFFAMILVRFLPDPNFRTREMLVLYVPVVAVYVLLWLLFGALFQIYGRYVLSYSRALIASLAGFLVIATLTYVVSQVAYSRIVLVSASALVAVLLPGWRLLIHMLQATQKVGAGRRAHRPSIFSRRAVILGAAAEGQRIASLLLRRPDTGIDLLGFVDDQAPPSGQTRPLPLPFLGRPGELALLVERHRFQEVIVAGESSTNERLMALLEQTRQLSLLFRIVPHEDEVMLGKANVEYIGDLPFVSVKASLYYAFHLFSKRAFDLLAAGLLTLLLLPAWPVLLLVNGLARASIWTVDGGHADVWLLRRGGERLRRLPLLWSIVRGDLSFVGAELVAADQPDPTLLFKPGITGLGRLRPVSDQPEVAMSYEHYYLQHQSFTFDLEIILKTLFKI